MADKKKYSIKRVVSNESDIVMEEFHLVDEKGNLVHPYVDSNKADVALLKLQNAIRASITLNAFLNMGGKFEGVRSEHVYCINPKNDSVISMEILNIEPIEKECEVPEFFVTFEDKSKSILDGNHIVIETKLTLFKE